MKFQVVCWSNVFALRRFMSPIVKYCVIFLRFTSTYFYADFGIMHRIAEWKCKRTKYVLNAHKKCIRSLEVDKCFISVTMSAHNHTYWINSPKSRMTEYFACRTV